MVLRSPLVRHPGLPTLLTLALADSATSMALALLLPALLLLRLP
jgi:hypothetical protein